MSEEPENPYGWLWGYARVSTDDQDLTLQREALMRFGVPAERIIAEHASGKTMKRKALRRLLDKYLREGDTLVIWKLDRLGRTLPGVLDAIETIQKQGINVVSLTEKIDTTSAMGRAFLQMALVFAELERNLISERTKAGMAARKAAGVRFGSPHLIRDNPKRIEAARQWRAEGILEAMTDRELLDALNAVRGQKEIQSIETVRRWRRAGYTGIDIEPDVPMAETEADE